MAKCTLGNHQPCASCGGFVDPGNEHVHHYSTKKGGVNQPICRECSTIIFIAAGCLLQACEEYRIATGDNTAVSQLVADQRIVVAIEQFLPMN